jgi:outer membrane protein OmpA-like peptidoglycan-associated protein
VNTNVNTSTTSGSVAKANTASAADNAGNSQNIQFNTNTPQNQSIKTVPTVFTPALTTTLTETCMGSSSLGVSVLGFGASGGTTWQDHQCIRRLNARELAQTLGDREAAREVLCGDDEIFRVYNALGRPCRLTPRGDPNPAWAPPPPPPPPPPPAPVVMPGPFIVFFDWDKSDITPEAASILDNAAAAYQKTGSASIELAGHTDKSGSDEYNQALSQRRADAVKAYLAGKGVPNSVMTTQAFGESQPLIDTADGVREPQNRRVEITFGPGSGH